MKKYTLPALGIAVALTLVFAFRDKPAKVQIGKNDSDSVAVSKIFSEALDNGMAHTWLDGLCKAAPKRLSGSAGAQKAVDYCYNLMKNFGKDDKSMALDSVWLQECWVPHWERGAPETGEMIVDGKHQHVSICALGGSNATPSDGLTAEVIEVYDYEDLEKLGRKKVEGKIVFFNHPFDDTKPVTFEAYGEAVGYRWAGPHVAETYGAVAVLVRSMTSSIDTFPHTGGMRTDSLKANIPAAAISTSDAENLSKNISSGKKVEFYMQMSCQWYKDEKSYNVIGEIRGSEHPEEVIVFGGHLDAWDLSPGAHDDGSGCMQAVEVLRIFKSLNIRPKHTIRAVMWMNEENGGRGGAAYAKWSADKKVKHIAAIESDAGGFSPRGFGLDMSPEQKAKVQTWQPLFYPYGVYDFTRGGGGADIEDLKEQGTPLFGLQPDSQRYFDYHHTEIDTIDKVNPRELHMGAGAMASLVYMIDKHGL